MQKRWTIQKYDREEVIKLSQALKVSPLIAALLISRDFESEEKARKFLNPSYEDLHEPLLLKDMQKAVERIFDAMEKGEKILI